ncbi:DUF748 domain-containing protein [Vibrio navarrensis]|uniref:DUF748 domain-containing protein n=1 Tax=Vibrio navarrensis TaxID=29495 RepID=UPI00051D91A0|nr:DUF748 domain-containing protein [Vibrio navarrensis]KGK12499.1 hypothetical protein EA24_01275 [Vibrio navarrensis]
MPSKLTQLLQRFTRVAKPIRYTIYLLFAYALYALSLGVILPAVIENKAPPMLAQQLGREVKLNQVAINPFLLRVRISGFALQEADGVQAFSQFERLELQLSFWRSLFTLTPTLEYVTLFGPQVRIQRLQQDNQVRFNFSDILDTLAQQTQQAQPPSPQSTESSLPALRIEKIEIASGQFHFQDQLTGAQLNYQGLNLHLQQFDTQAMHLVPADNSSKPTNQTQANQYAFAIQGADKSELQLSGQFQLQPLFVDGTVKLQGLTLPPFWPFAKDQMDAAVTDGVVNFSAHYLAQQAEGDFLFAVSDGQFQLSDLTISAEQQAKIKLPRLAVQDIRLSSQTKDIDIAAIELQGLWLDAEFSEQGLDLQRLFRLKNQPAAKVEATAVEDNSDADSAWLVRLAQFSLSETDLNLKEQAQSSGVFWRVYPLSLVAGPVSSDLNAAVDYELSLGLSSSTAAPPQTARGEVTTRGSFDAKALSVQGEMAIEGLDLTQLQPYLTPYVNIDFSQGKLSSQGRYQADVNGQASYQGTLAIDQLLLKDGMHHQPLVKWQKMAIDSLHFDAQKHALDIQTIHFNAPYAKVMIAQDKQTNIGNLLVQQSDTQEETAMSVQSDEASAASKPLAIDIQAITITNGAAYFADESLTPNFASGIEALQGSVRHLSSTPGTKAQVDISGKIDRYAPVTLKGEINPLIEKPYLDLDLLFKSVELTSVNPYSGTYAGYYIDKGQLTLALNYQLQEDQLLGNNHLVIDQLQLGKPSESDLATSLPISLAIALLQDKDGVIDLGLQVSGDVNDPDFSVGGIILQAISNVIVKAVSAPFSLLAHLVGADEELNLIAFDFGSSTLNAKEQERLSTLAQALSSRPKLKISVAASVALAQDSKALAEQQLQQTLLQKSGLETLPSDFSASRLSESKPLSQAAMALAETQLSLDIDQERSKVAAQLAEKAGEEAVLAEQVETTLMIGLYNQLLNSIEISKNQLSNLAEARAKAVKAFLVDEAQLAPERVFLLDSKTQLRSEESAVELSVSAD